VKRVMNVSRESFRPAPDVMSTVIRIEPHQPPRLTLEEEGALRLLTRAAFGQRRKQFQRILRDAYALTPEQVEEVSTAAGMDLVQRPETFSPERFVGLTRVLLGRGYHPTGALPADER
jgi:16S rRNA (adenine1518-N6/adenine1519-N6)-dimethyltransferase